ncbi:hypothetical protein [Nocardiopsis valliformis]|uniref:hypothetical protein n=1 Tax=Nocardiopsis valliformis TaxID=239974 RepID=UPI000345DCE8|nr:hypothetical protein [Nocardiopsis valliformis]
MRVDLGEWLFLVNRNGAFTAQATLSREGTGEMGPTTSEHRLVADGPLDWEYVASAGDRENRWSCDGRELVQAGAAAPAARCLRALDAGLPHEPR